jgi:NCAIR mutase (PurE)-related protein
VAPQGSNDVNQWLLDLLRRMSHAELSYEEAVREVSAHLPDEDREVIVDHGRWARTGAPEVVLGEWKTGEQIAEIVATLASRGQGALATRVSADKAAIVAARNHGGQYLSSARAFRIMPDAVRPGGVVAVVAAGTSDLPVVDEAVVTAEFLGARVVRIVDVGVAGIHRLLARIDDIRKADAVVVVAGMEGALPSVIAGLVDRPLIAVPTSVAYGVGAGGLAALASMLSSCAPGVTVVNIDNGFGAAVAAVRVARLIHEGVRSEENRT